MVGGVVMVALSSCNGDGDRADPASIPTSATSGPSTTLRPVDTSFTGQNNTQFCALAKTYTDRSAGVNRATTPDQLRASVQESRSTINQVATAAPAEIKADSQILANAFGTLFTELEKANFDPTRLSLTAFAPLQAPEFTQATTRFQAYLRTICGIG
jgi:hypothetical protein